jgi:hypothetical protein
MLHEREYVRLGPPVFQLLYKTGRIRDEFSLEVRLVVNGSDPEPPARYNDGATADRYRWNLDLSSSNPNLNVVQIVLSFCLSGS